MNADCLGSVAPDDVVMDIIDRNATYHTMTKIPSTFGEISKKILSFDPQNTQTIFSTDSYHRDSVKSAESRRRETGTKLIVGGPETKNWKAFLEKEENKVQLSEMLYRTWTLQSFGGTRKNKDVYLICKVTRITSNGAEITTEEMYALESN